MNEYYEPAEEEADERSVGSSQTSADEVDEEEIRLENYPLPPLPAVSAPETVHSVPTSEVYSIIKELRRQLDDPVERERAKAMLRSDTNVLLAVSQVLQEARLLRRAFVNEQGSIEEELVPQPEAPKPQLPTGYHSWVLEESPRHYR